MLNGKAYARISKFIWRGNGIMADVQENKAKKLNLDTLEWKGMTWIDIAPPVRAKSITWLRIPFPSLDLDDTLSRRQRNR